MRSSRVLQTVGIKRGRKRGEEGRRGSIRGGAACRNNKKSFPCPGR